MKEFHLEIVTPDGLKFDGAAESLLVRTTEGDVEFLAGHADYFAALGTGRARIVAKGGEQRLAAASGGFVSVSRSGVKLVATTFEFAEEIDLARARAARERAEAAAEAAKDERELAVARAKLMRALSRIHVAEL